MKTVLVTGTFDFLHGGHLYMLKNAGKYGDKLVVLIARDKTVKKIKGQLPIHTEDERRELVSHLDMVDKAVLGDQKDPFKVITKIKPDVICLGYDQQHTFSLQLKEALEDRGLKTRIVQLKPHKEKRLKSSQLRKKSMVRNLRSHDNL